MAVFPYALRSTVLAILLACPLMANVSDEAQRILDTTEVKGGLVVHLGAGNDGGKLTAALRVNERYQVHGLAMSAANLAKARTHVFASGDYGDVSIDLLSGTSLPYVDNLVNLVVGQKPAGISDDEIRRVLVPNGVAYLKSGDQWTKFVKPVPVEIDEWTHFLHGPGGNAVAADTVVGPPRHLQWVGSPRWSRHHDRMASMSALVSSGGRIFYIMDEGSRVSIQLPPKWKLVARDAFNGKVLWKRDIPKWHSHLWPLKSGPTQLARRLVAIDDRVYVTLGINAPAVALDAVTGQTLVTYDGSEGTQEIVVNNGTILMVGNKNEMVLSRYNPTVNTGDQARVRRDLRWSGDDRFIIAADLKTGKQLWKTTTNIALITVASVQDAVLYFDGEQVICVDRQTGSQRWKTQLVKMRGNRTFNFGPKLVIKDNVVLFAGGDRMMHAFDLNTGKELWNAPHARGGYESPEDLLVIGNLVWSAPTTSSGDSGVFTGRDFRTGEVKEEFGPNVKTYWFHHRCHMAKATENYLLPSRTGIEFVDPKKQDWDIHHWVRGGCLYGIMPCNGLVYAPPHNCACYPEAKLFGLNALAPASASRSAITPIKNRLERGPAFGRPIKSTGDAEWPTYRGSSNRSGFTGQSIDPNVTEQWRAKIGGRLSSIVVGEGKLFVSQIDAHTVHALDAASGKPAWTFTTGGRVDSPPTIYNGRVIFGSADGRVYCLRASDGELVWRFIAAVNDRRLMSFEQLESVWPVHGSILVRDGVAYFIAGRSNFLDSGLRFYRVDVNSGATIGEVVIDDREPESGKDIQNRIQILNMPVGLPDVLTCDDKFVYMRSQRFDLEGNRQDLGPHSGDPRGQGSVQRGEGTHLFSPTGFLDGTWFHRSYWVYGRSFAGGHSGYHQAGKFAASGRIMVFNDDNVYGFGRKPQYYRWTTTMEHQLFGADRNPPEVPAGPVNQARRRGGSGQPMIRVPIRPSLDPTGKPLAVEAWVNASSLNGVVIARGGPANGFAITVQRGVPVFHVRYGDSLSTVTGGRKIVGKWTHLMGVLTSDKKVELYVNGKPAGKSVAAGFLTSDPVQGMEIGADETSAVGDYQSPNRFGGTIDEVRVYLGSVTAKEVAARFNDAASTPASAKLVAGYSFDKGKAQDISGNGNHGSVVSIQSTEDGHAGRAMKFVAPKVAGKPSPRGKRNNSYHVKHDWTSDISLLVRGMVLADKTLFIAGPPDMVDEEESFQRIVNRDQKIQDALAKQDAVLQGKDGGLLQAVSTKDGLQLMQLKVPSLPVWDGLIAARGGLYMATTDGDIVFYGQ